MRGALADGPKRVNAALHNMGTNWAERGKFSPKNRNSLDLERSLTRNALHMIRSKQSIRTGTAMLALAAAALLLPANPLQAQKDCGEIECSGDTAADHKAKRKGGWREGRTPEDNRQRALEAKAAAEVAEAALYPPVIQDYEPSPAIWKLADDDTTIYMFGTFHILPKDFRWRSAAFNQIVLDAEQLIVETSNEDDSSGDDVFIGAMIANILDPTRETISERLTEANRPKWRKAVEMSGASLAAVDRMPLFLSMMGIGLGYSQQMGSKREYGVETVLEAEFKKAGKPIGSIEDGNEVMKNLISIDENLLIADLEESLTKWDGETMESFMASTEPGSDNPGEEIGPFDSEHSWAQGKLDDIDESSFGDSEGGKQVYRVLLIDRNRAWAEWLDKRLDEPGTILVAVGAAHFEGADSVQVMLNERDLTAERIH